MREAEFNLILGYFQDLSYKLAKHCPTRWLTHQQAIKRVVLCWPSPVAYVTDLVSKELVE